MTSPALSVVYGGGPNRLTRTVSTPRLRPGERPIAVDLELTSQELKVFRSVTRGAGIGVDAYVSVLLEYRSLCELAGRAHVVALADGVRARECLDVVATLELQSWHRLITGRAASPGDDLPTVFIPLRLATALPPNARAEAVKHTILADVDEIQRAVTLETIATARGVVMQTWVLAQLVGVSGGATTTL